MRVLIAFDKFKGALAAPEACSLAAEALARVQPDWKIETAPLADGGDGFCDTLAAVAKGELRRHVVTGPDGTPTPARYALVPTRGINPHAMRLLELPQRCSTLALVELAQSSGLTKLRPESRSPWTTTTYGLGETLLAAVANGADCALIGLGGSATHDLAFGALQVVGFSFQTEDGSELGGWPSPCLWERLTAIKPPAQPRLALPLRLACDVEHGLIGPQGAAAVFGPQKGLEPGSVERLDQLTRKVAELLCRACGANHSLIESNGSGAAGGSAFGLMAGLEARPLRGAPLVFAWTGLPAKLERAELVITGEGCFDASSLLGKGPGSLAQQALSLGKRVHLLAGRLGDAPADFLSQVRALAITPPDVPLQEALSGAARNLQNTIAARFGPSSSRMA